MASTTSAYTPDTQPIDVGTSTHTVKVPVRAAVKGVVRKVFVEQTGGSATDTTVRVTLDSAATDETKEIAEFAGVDTSNPVQHDNGGEGYSFPYNEASIVADTTNNIQEAELFVQVVPNTGTDNDYTIKLVL